MKLYPWDFSCDVVEELWGNGFGDWIIPFLFPAGNEVESFVTDHLIKFWNFIRTILQVGIEGDDDFTLCCPEAGLKRGGFPKISIEPKPFEPFVLLVDFDNLIPGRIHTSIVDHYDFIRKTVFKHDTAYPLAKLR